MEKEKLPEREQINAKQFKKNLSEIMKQTELHILFRLGICGIDDQIRLDFITFKDQSHIAEEAKQSDLTATNGAQEKN